jgi:N-ethylmaleimide reductase
VRRSFSGRIIYAGLYDAARAARIIEAGLGDFIAFGRPFIANPDLPQRIANGWPLNKIDPASLYGGGAQGFTDYPVYCRSESDVKEEVLS